MKRNKRSLFYLVVFIFLLDESSYAQSFVEDISIYRPAKLEEFIMAHPGRTFSIRENYPPNVFERSAAELEKLYFNEVGSSLESTDSLSVSNNFRELPRSLSRQYRKETKKLVKRMERLNTTIVHSSDFTIEPRYLLRVETPDPVAFTLSLEYLLIDKAENMSYRITQ
jgi:hypothetical protein